LAGTFIRSAALQAFPELARAHGLDPHQLLRLVGLDAGVLESDDLRIPASFINSLLEVAADMSGEPAFGLRLAETRRLSTLGRLGLLARDEPTLRAALLTMIRYGWMHNEALVVDLDESGPQAVIQVSLLDKDAGRQSIELAVGATYRFLRIFLGSEWRSRAVCFMHSAPADTGVHRRFFRCPLRFAQDFNGLVLNADHLDTPIALADPVLGQLYRQLLPQQPPAGAPQTVYEVQQLLLALMPSGRARLGQIAALMNVDRKTIHRNLLAQGTSFGQLLEQTRTLLLQRYLQQDTHTLTEIGSMLGFGSLSAFSRWRRARRPGSSA
jgi:AraC-like DNA-binding protein